MRRKKKSGVESTRFQVERLQKQIEILEHSRSDLEGQIRKLTDAVPEETVEKDAVKDGYMAYGSYAQAIIARRDNLRLSLEDVHRRHSDLAGKLKMAMDSLDAYERVQARKIANEAEKKARRA